MLRPLLDRIEIISIPAYLPIEKIQISKKYLIPKFEKEYAYKSSEIETVAVQENDKPIEIPTESIDITDAAIQFIINHYCGHEAGVRNLRKAID